MEEKSKTADFQWIVASVGMCENRDHLVITVLSRSCSIFGLHWALCSLGGLCAENDGFFRLRTESFSVTEYLLIVNTVNSARWPTICVSPGCCWL